MPFSRTDLERILANPTEHIAAFSRLLSEHSRGDPPVEVIDAIVRLVVTTRPSQQFGVYVYDRITKIGSEAYGARKPAPADVPIIEGLIAYCRAGRHQTFPNPDKQKLFHAKFFAREARLTNQLGLVSKGEFRPKAYDLYTHAIMLTEDGALLGTFYSYRGIIAEQLGESNLSMMVTAAKDAVLSASYADAHRKFYEHAHACKRFLRAATLVRQQETDDKIERRTIERDHLGKCISSGLNAVESPYATPAIRGKCYNNMARAAASLIPIAYCTDIRDSVGQRRQYFAEAKEWYQKALELLTDEYHAPTVVQIKHALARLDENWAKHECAP